MVRSTDELPKESVISATVGSALTYDLYKYKYITSDFQNIFFHLFPAKQF